jgi:urea carboxylase
MNVCRLVTPKYNPARTFTWEGTVGLGGSYMCIYPMNSPGGYQLIGRTLPIWNTHGHTREFTSQKPWLLEIFDQIQFYEVPESELELLRMQFQTGEFELEISAEEFDFGAHAAFCADLEPKIAEWKARQKTASAVLAQEDSKILQRLEASGYTAGGGGGREEEVEGNSELDLSAFRGEGYEVVVAPFVSSVWHVDVAEGDHVDAGQQLGMLEAMKVETAVTAPRAGTVAAVGVAAGVMVHRGQGLFVIKI